MEGNKTVFFLLSALVLVAFVGLIQSSNLGSWWYAGEHIQLNPHEACERLGCTLSEGYKMSEPYRETAGGPNVMCECPSGLTSGEPRYVLTSLVRKAHTFPYTAGRTIQGVKEVPGYPEPIPVVESRTAYERTGMSIYQRRYPGKIYSVLTSCQGLVDNQVIDPMFTEPMTFQEAMSYGYDTANDCIYTLNLIGGKGYCCKRESLKLR